MKEAIVLTAALLAGCATPQQRHITTVEHGQDSVEVYRNLISAELDEALRSPENVSLAETFLAIDHLEREGDKAVRQGKPAIAKAYYGLALKNINRWIKAFAAALHIWYIDNMLKRAHSRPEVTPDVQKILDQKMDLAMGDVLFEHKKRLHGKISNIQ